MLEWISANLSTIIISAVVFLIIALDIVYLVRQRKKGKSLCGNNCAGCAMRGKCHSTSADPEDDAKSS